MTRLFLILAATFGLSTSYIPAGKQASSPKSTETDSVAFAAAAKASTTNSSKVLSDAERTYAKIAFKNAESVSFSVFEKAFRGFVNLKVAGKIASGSRLLSICDFSLSSNRKRLWVIDTGSGEVLYNSLVAHGKNTGEEFAERFSNAENSLESSLGFYITGDTYNGENGYSLKLNGMDRGYNDNALQRSIVVHGADYVSEDFARREKRIGRSWGCPALPRDLATSVINTIKNGCVLFIYGKDGDYLKSSEWLKDRG